MLIVDDSPSTLTLLATMFQAEAVPIRMARSGALALASARRQTPDLILLDIGMPRMDGYEVCTRLKADPDLRGIPVIFITGREGLADKVRAFGAGCVDYVTKPFHPEEVQARVRAQLALRGQARQLRQQYDQLQELERVRDSLVHMIVHDMRSPLLALQAALEVVQTAPSAARRPPGQTLEYALRATAQLTTMANQLLDISRLEAGRMPLRLGKHDLVPTLTEALRASAALAGTRRVDWRGPASLPVIYDEEIIGRVLTNLLANAYKFTPQTGEVRLFAAAEPVHARISVADTGCGIAPEHHQALFEKFRQVELRRKGVGTGLGLAFCKLAVEAHGGRIGVASAPGKGSTFWFTLPLAPAHG